MWIPNPLRRRRIEKLDLALIILLLVTQVWLLSATLDNYLAGHADSALAGALISGVLFLACGALYLLVMRLERRRRIARPSPLN